VSAFLLDYREGGFDFDVPLDLVGVQGDSELLGRTLKMPENHSVARMSRIPQHRHARGAGKEFPEQ
jgi:hypothetical protein